MTRLEALYPEAIEHTKSKVWEDVYRYLGSKSTPSSFEDYLTDRKHYLE